MIWNNLFSKKNLQEILQICIIILNHKKFFNSTFIFIILFARNSLNKVLNYYLKFTRNSLNFHSLKKHQFKTSIFHLLLFQQLLSSFIMICNVKSVESWTTHLLKSIVNRKVSLLLIDASVEVEKAIIAWNINIEEQLLHWVSNQLDEVINMLNEFQSQWNLTLQLNEHWLLIQEDYKKRAKQLEVTFDKKWWTREKDQLVTRWVIELQSETTSSWLIYVSSRYSVSWITSQLERNFYNLNFDLSLWSWMKLDFWSSLSMRIFYSIW